jgi:hypothetical protein
MRPQLPLTSAGIALGLLLIAAPRAHAQDAGRWIVHADVGAAAIHRFVSAPEGAAAGVRIARAWMNDRLLLDAGVLGSSADRGFFLVDFGGELRFCGAGCRVAPFVGGAAGSLIEPIYGDSKSRRIGGGVEVRLGPKQLLRFSAYSGGHSANARGPHVITIGYVRRFGASR